MLLRFGQDSSIELSPPPGALVAACDAPRGEPLADVAAVVAEALAQPLEFPSLRRAVVPGDKVTLALAAGVPCAGMIASAVAAELVAGGISPPDITILWSERELFANGDPRGELAGYQRPALDSQATGIAAELTVQVHNPVDRAQLGYLAATSGGNEVHLSRAVFDADLVVPIGCLRLEPTAGYFGPHGGVFPTFASATTQARFRGLDAADAPADAHDRGHEEANEVGWLLGTQCTLQVVPGTGDQALHVLFGGHEAVERIGRERCEAAWQFRLPRRADLVVAAIAGGPRHQTWENVGRALDAASRLVEDGGAIAILCELAADSGPAMQRLSGVEDRWGALRRLKKDPPTDLLPATRLVQALDRGRVYLLSRLDESVVEDLGMTALSSGTEVARLVARQKSCILLANAQHVTVSVEESP